MTRNVLPTTLVLALLLGGGCRHRPAPPAPPSVTNIVILLPNEDGNSSGSVVVSNPAGRQQLVDAYSGVTVRAADAPPTAPAHVDPAEVQRLFGAILTTLPAPEARFNLYFETGGTTLTKESIAELPKIIEAYRLRRSTDVTIIGHTDTTGDRQSNYQLGLQRAEQISHDIQASGVNGSHIFIESHGQNDLLVPTGDNMAEPRNRRVEVIVR
jgi:outer membrane protein OmpA-like peptidoglycan-associated protein